MAFAFPELKDDFTAPNGITYSWLDDRWIVRSSSRRLAATRSSLARIHLLMLRLVIFGIAPSLMI